MILGMNMKILFRFGKATVILLFRLFVILFKFFFDEPAIRLGTKSNNAPSHDALGTQQFTENAKYYDENGNKHF